MIEYISKHDVINITAETGAWETWNRIRELPSTDVQPVVHGKWEEVEEYGGWGDTHYRCSVCGKEWFLEDGTPQQNNMNFCPRCGARMDGETNE